MALPYCQPPPAARPQVRVASLEQQGPGTSTAPLAQALAAQGQQLAELQQRVEAVEGSSGAAHGTEDSQVWRAVILQVLELKPGSL